GRLPARGPDLTLSLWGGLLIRHTWLQARAAAPPAHPRVTGDHHA
ncbi:PepSY domain-containing protein, partial [Pseudomonas aeruginosa]